MKIAQVVLMLFLCLALTKSYAQCNTQPYTEKGIKRLEQGFTFLKSYPISGETGKNYSYIFSHGTKYLITLANNEADAKGVYVTLMDSKKKVVASSYNNGKFYQTISFTPSATGIYSLKFSFEKTKDFCAAGVLAMKR